MESNNAKLREALAEFVDCWDNCNYAEMGKQLVEQARAALSSPPRNCDVGTAEEQAKRYGDYCDNRSCSECPCCGKVLYGKCEFAWAQMPYNEGSAK